MLFAILTENELFFHSNVFYAILIEMLFHTLRMMFFTILTEFGP